MPIRNFQWNDLPAVVETINSYERALGGQGTVTVAQVERSWRSPYNHPERDCFVAVDANDEPVAFTIADLLENPSRANGVYTVPPAHEAHALTLIHAAESHFAAIGSDAGAPTLTMQWRISDRDEHAASLLESAGYLQVRTFYTMQIDLPEPIEPVELPDGLTLRPFVAYHLEAVYEATAEAFADHWGEREATISEWRADIAREGFDPSLWWTAVDGGEIAGVLLSQPSSLTSAWVGMLGVRRPWRKRGLAYALLRTSFAEYQRRGFQRVLLGVDSESATRAVALYERAGMRVQASQLYYERSLAPVSM